jgi:PqqD family protein of HPr-rel-A system
VPPPIWRVQPARSLHWRQFGDEWVVFDEGSGDVHRMDGLSAVVLMCLGEAPCGLADLSPQAAAETDLPEGEELSRTLASVLEKYAALGLIEPAAP